MARYDQKARIARLLATVPQFKDWIEGVGGLTTDEQGRTVILGLDAAETVEMLQLRPQMSAARDFRLCAKSTLPRGGLAATLNNPSESTRRTGPQ